MNPRLLLIALGGVGFGMGISLYFRTGSWIDLALAILNGVATVAVILLLSKREYR